MESLFEELSNEVESEGESRLFCVKIIVEELSGGSRRATMMIPIAFQAQRWSVDNLSRYITRESMGVDICCPVKVGGHKGRVEPQLGVSGHPGVAV